MAPLEDAYRLLSRVPQLSVRRNGSQSLYVRVDKEDIASVNALLVANGIRVTELAPQRETLEEVFFNLLAHPKKRIKSTTHRNRSRLSHFGSHQFAYPIPPQVSFPSHKLQELAR